MPLSPRRPALDAVALSHAECWPAAIPTERLGFAYNLRNRPVTVTRTGDGTQTSRYLYNALEQMVSRTTNAPGGPSGTVHYIYGLDGALLAEADAATGATLRDYIWLPQGDASPAADNDNEEGASPAPLPLALATAAGTAAPQLLMVHADHLGRPVRLTDTTRATVWQASYDPFGQPVSVTGALDQNLRFPGQYFLIETGLSYNWHRFYDPATGRYTQPDPLRFVDGPSVYAYAAQSPMMRVDPEGLIILPDDPSGLPPDWTRDPTHQNPKGSKWRNPDGGCIEFHEPTPGAPGYRGKPHWHDCTDPNDKKKSGKHRLPGEDCPQPGDIPSPDPRTPPWWQRVPPPLISPMPGGGGGGGRCGIWDCSLVPNL